MKFSKKNILFKMMFVALMAFICFNVNEVKAEGTCTYTFENKGTRTFTSKNNEFYNDGDAFNNQRKYKHTYDDKFKNAFINDCPKEIYAVESFDIQPYQKNFTITYYLDKTEAEKMAKARSNKSSVATFYSAILSNKHVCISTGDTEFSMVLAAARDLSNANAWSQESDTKVAKINAYMANAKKNNISFCDENSLNTIVAAVNKYNEVVSKDPNAPQNKKEAINKQSDAIEENVVLLKKYTLSNKTNITLPEGGNLNKCEELISEDLMYVINLILRIIQIGGPILLIILVAVDFGQVVISNDKDAMPKAVSKAIKRGIAAIAIFFVPYFVSLILDWLNNYSSITGAANCIK